MEKSDYEKEQELVERMGKHPLLVALREAQDNIRSYIRDVFNDLKDENDTLLLKEEEKFDLNDGDELVGLTLEDGALQAITELEDGEPWNMDLRDISTENLVDIIHILIARKSL